MPLNIFMYDVLNFLGMDLCFEYNLADSFYYFYAKKVCVKINYIIFLSFQISVQKLNLRRSLGMLKSSHFITRMITFHELSVQTVGLMCAFFHLG